MRPRVLLEIVVIGGDHYSRLSTRSRLNACLELGSGKSGRNSKQCTTDNLVLRIVTLSANIDIISCPGDVFNLC